MVHGGPNQACLPVCGRGGEVGDAAATGGSVLHQLPHGRTATEVIHEVHHQHEARAVIGVALIPPPHRQGAVLRPAVHVTGQGAVGPETEVNRHVGVPFVDVEVLIGIQCVVQQVLQFVSDDGAAPRQGHVRVVHEDHLTLGRETWCEVTADVVLAIDVVDDDLDLAVVVHVGRRNASPVPVILPVVGRQRRVDGLVPGARQVLQHRRTQGSAGLDQEGDAARGFRHRDRD